MNHEDRNNAEWWWVVRESLYFNICAFSSYYLLTFPTANLDNVNVKYWSLDFHYLEQTIQIVIVKFFFPVVLMSEQSTSLNVPGESDICLACFVLPNSLRQPGKRPECEGSI